MEDDDGTEAATRDLRRRRRRKLRRELVLPQRRPRGRRAASSLLLAQVFHLSRRRENNCEKSSNSRGTRSSECLFYFCGFFRITLERIEKKRNSQEDDGVREASAGIARRRPPSKAWMSPRSSSVAEPASLSRPCCSQSRPRRSRPSSSSFSASYSRVAVFYSTVLIAHPSLAWPR